MSSIAGHRVGTTALAGRFVRTAPYATITGPGSTVLSVPFTVTWTYSSPAARPQVSYRVRLQSVDSSVTLYDSNTIASAATSHVVPFLLSAGSEYRLLVTLGDGFDTGDDSSTFEFDADVSATAASVNRDVGTIYEVAINGVGYMLADRPEGEPRYERRVVPLDTPRLSTSETPFSQSIDRYTLAGTIDWTGGAGQSIAERSGSSSSAYRASDGINPFERGTIRLAPQADLALSTTFGSVRAVVAGSKLYTLVGHGQFSVLDDPADTTPTTFTISGAGNFRSVTSDGTFWYYADGADIYRNDTPASAAAWSATNAHVVQWCSDRIFAARPGTGSTPNVLVELSPTGAEVGGSRVWTLQESTTITSITAGDGYVWFAAARSSESAVFSVRLGVDESYRTAFQLPNGQRARAVSFYQGNVFVRATDDSGRTIIYRCAANQGTLTPSRVMEIPAGVDNGTGDFAGDDRYVYFSWRQMGEQLLDPARTGSGVGAIDLATGGWAKWAVHRQATTEGTGAVGSVVMWYGRPVFTIDGYGAMVCDVPDGLGDDGTVNSGVLETSLMDLGTGLRKVWSELQATFDPLPVGGSVELSYSTDGGISFDTLPAVDTPGARGGRWTLGIESDAIAVRVKLTGTTQTPSFRTLTVRANPVGLADQILVLPVRCADRVAGLNGRELPGGSGAGVRAARALEALVQTRVAVQDIDWRVTGAVTVYDMVAAEVRSVGVYDRAKGRRSDDLVVNVTLRRSVK